MSMQLTPRVEALIRRKIDTGSYSSADDLIEDALRALDERDQARLARLRGLIQDGFASGPGIEVTAALMDEIEREAEEAFQRGERPDPDASL